MDREALQKMTVAELREEAKKIPDAKGLSSMKKDDLVELIASHGGGTAAAAPQAAGGTLDKAGLKQRIRALKEQKREALAAQDRPRVTRCNREIHRCKRLLRKMARASAGA